LASLGAALILTGRREDALIDVADTVRSAGGSAVCFGGVDLSDPAQVGSLATRLVTEFDGVDILVSNAGWDLVEPFLESREDSWDHVLHVNLRAPIHLTHAVLPGMVDRGWGRLVFVSSDAGRVGSKGEAVYAAAKSGLFGFSKTIAREAARAGVTSNVVCPGPTRTPLFESVEESNQKLTAALARRIPMGRLGEPSDVSGLVAFLATDRAGYITGQTISVSGGLTMV
jgi:2-hydroxycyclohexanecarboxyl-CoA dehydrogenase